MSLVATSGADSLSLDVPPWGWAAFLGLISVLLLVDLLVVHRDAHVPSFRRAFAESMVWIAIGVSFSLVLLGIGGGAAAGQYLTGYLIEKSLSVDNVFVWALVLSYYGVPRQYQHRVLFWGIFGALVLRAAFIFGGIALLERLEWMIYVFGAILLYTAGRLLFGPDEEFEPSESRLLRSFKRLVRSTDDYDGHKLFTLRDGLRLATPLFFVLIVIETTDVVFAVDSIPAILAVSRDEFIVFTSNAFAILGLRALYFLLADLHGRFHYLKTGLAVILAFVGVKMVLSGGVPGLPDGWHPPTWLSLAVIVVVLAASITASVLRGDPDAAAPEAWDEVDPRHDGSGGALLEPDPADAAATTGSVLPKVSKQTPSAEQNDGSPA
jgi:tellurite resistance protein TerC